MLFSQKVTMTHSLSLIFRWLSPLCLTGPIFDKELRVSSRRRRNYVLRFVYLLLLLTFIGIVWVNLDFKVSSPAQMSRRMSEAGTQVTCMIVVFQFVVLQLLAITMLSTAISDEISHKTLGVLMTTPITSLHIVLGKLLSRCFQFVSMAAITTNYCNATCLWWYSLAFCAVELLSDKYNDSLYGCFKSLFFHT